MSKRSKLIYLFCATLFFIIFDLYFSSFVINNLDSLNTNPVIDFVAVQNYGAAFSILQNSRIFLITFSIIAMFLIVINLIKYLRFASCIAIFWNSMLLAGIFCNTYERIVQGYVRDFFSLNFINFPVFNISDIFINLSVFAIVVIIIKNNYSKNNENNN